MKTWLKVFVLAAGCFSAKGFSQSIESELAEFKQLYQTRLGSVTECETQEPGVFRVCSPALKSEGNAPYILHHQVPTANKAVLFHGLSDSPYFFKAIAERLHANGFNVVVALLPGHGQIDADDDMEDWDLAERWQQHVDDVLDATKGLGNKTFVGGFSTGGALAVQTYFIHPDKFDGLMLFSGALALSEDAENMSNIWGIKLVAQLVDGHYETDGPNPYKYPNVAGFAGLELMDVIKDIRERIDNGQRVKVPLFVAHSEADVTTPIGGVEHLVANTDANTTFFVIDNTHDLCHADVVVSDDLLAGMNFDKTKLEQEELCAIPEANPLFGKMMVNLLSFLQLNGANI